MLYTPKSYKYLKQYKNNRKTSVVKTPVTGNFRYLIIATECGIITARQIEALRRFLTRRISTKVRLIRYVTLHKAFTCKGSKSRMGKGYGKLEGWLGYIWPGSILFVVASFTLSDINELTHISCKLPFKCVIKQTCLKFK